MKEEWMVWGQSRQPSPQFPYQPPPPFTAGLHFPILRGFSGFSFLSLVKRTLMVWPGLAWPGLAWPGLPCSVPFPFPPIGMWSSEMELIKRSFRLVFVLFQDSPHQLQYRYHFPLLLPLPLPFHPSLVDRHIKDNKL